jgi:hypothetical protein
MLQALLGTYLDRAPVGLSALPRYDEDALDAVHFAWAGPTAPGQPHYYRLQGPRLLIEWDNTQRNANHAHSVWRDPTSDFGLMCLPATARRIMPDDLSHPAVQRFRRTGSGSKSQLAA